MRYKRQTNCVYSCWHHLVFTTKYRRKIFTPGVWDYCEKKFKEVTRHYPQIEIREINHDRDHVHLLVSIPPKMAVGNAVRLLKSNTSRALMRYFNFLQKMYYVDKGIWSDGYFVSTTGVNTNIVQKYIEHQGKEDCAQAELDFN